VTKTYMEILYPGSFVAETSTKPVKSRTVPKTRPEGAFAVRFFDQSEVEKDGEILTGKQKNFSPFYYWGEEFTCAEIKKKFPTETILYSNVHGNGYKRAVRTVVGNWRPLEPKDIVIAKG
jgi:hypothetical protein